MKTTKKPEEQAWTQKDHDRASKSMVEIGVRRCFWQAHPGQFSSRLARACYEDLGLGWFVHGLEGRGKTHLAAAAAHAVFLKKPEAFVIFRMAKEVLRRIRETYSPTAVELESKVLHELCSADLLVIDDFEKDGAKLNSEGVVGGYVNSAIHETLARRLDDMLPTIVTSNMSLDEIRERYGGPIESRLSILKPIVLEGKDRRKEE